MKRISISADTAAGLEWAKSSYSSSSNGEDCVEVAATPQSVYVRDSKDVQGPRVAIPAVAWNAFVAHVAEG